MTAMECNENLPEKNSIIAMIVCWQFWRATNRHTDRRTVGHATPHYVYASRHVCSSVQYVATLPCNLLLMACFADINVSQQGSVATYARCDGIFNIHFTTNLPRNLPVIF